MYDFLHSSLSWIFEALVILDDLLFREFCFFDSFSFALLKRVRLLFSFVILSCSLRWACTSKFSISALNVLRFVTSFLNILLSISIIDLSFCKSSSLPSISWSQFVQFDWRSEAGTAGWIFTLGLTLFEVVKSCFPEDISFIVNSEQIKSFSLF